MTTFTVKAGSAAAVRVEWRTEEKDFWFVAHFEGDELGDVVPSKVGRVNIPRVWSKPNSLRGTIGRSADARQEPFPTIIAEARIAIREGGLITKAREAFVTAAADRERQRVADRAKAMREALIPLLSREGREALAAVPDRALSDVFEAIQGSSY